MRRLTLAALRLVAHLALPAAPLVLTACGTGPGSDKTPETTTEWEQFGLTRNDAGDMPIPAEVRAYMQRRAWGYAHDRWHKERLWDMQTDQSKGRLLSDGFKPFDKKSQGAVGSGVEFLAMHRHMFRELRERFPQYAPLWAAWTTIPREKDSPLVPVAARSDLSAEALAALDRLENEATLAEFASADELGLYIWTNRLVAPDGTVTTRTDGAGLHDTTLHQRWANARSDINLSEFSLTHENYIFWKMHGWVDERWTLWRRLKGLPESDADLEAVIDAQGREMMESEAFRSDEVRAELESGTGHGH